MQRTKGHWAMSRDIFRCHSGGGYWHLEGRDQGCCKIPYSAQDGSQTEELTQLKKSAVLGLTDPTRGGVTPVAPETGRQDRVTQDFSSCREQN